MKFVLAPLAGFTNAAFRKVCSDWGADLTYTEMVSAAGLAHGSSPTRHLMEVLPGEGPVVCQIFGAKPDELAFAAREATACNRFAAIDFNAGCPMPKIVREGAGAALVRNPQRIHDCLKAIKAETTLPITLKTRPGPRPDKVLLWEILDAAETAGCQGITLHARFTSQMHGGPVHLDLLAELVDKARIPVTGNGGVVDLPTMRHMAQTGVSAIMLGRAAVSSPWLFADLRKSEGQADEAGPPQRVALQEKTLARHLEYLKALHAQLLARFPADHIPGLDDYVCVAARLHLFRYFNGRPGSAALRRRLAAIHTLDAFLDAVRACRPAPEEMA
ncbi:MAG: tRNA dihydrouridine synthase [Kiritimatiellia bacterium]